MKFYFNGEDASQIAIGAFAMALLISFSEEVWLLAETLPLANLLLISVLSLFFLVYFSYYHCLSDHPNSGRFSAYGFKSIPHHYYA